jgi:hypothetical protein
MMTWIDLHTHTTASDGDLTPARLVDHALQQGLSAVAVTDHDTVAGVDEAMARGREVGLEVVPGVEISTSFKPGSMHVLGYFIDHRHPALTEKLGALQAGRSERNPRILAKLNELGLDISWDEITTAAGGGQVGRPHFARVLTDKGLVNDTQEAFDRYLAKGAPAYVGRFNFTPEEAIELLAEAGGLPVLAHPCTLKLERTDELAGLLERLKKHGLAGLEAYYSQHSPAMARKYVKLAERFDLAVTGGSDFHGQSKLNVVLGRVGGGMGVPAVLLGELKKRRTRP